MRLAVLIAAALWLSPHAGAADVPVYPVGFDASVRQTLAGAESTAEAKLTGDGEKLTFRYSSAAPLDVIIFLRDLDGAFDIATALRAKLPAGTGAAATLDLTRSSAWRPGERTYDVFVVSPDPAGATVHEAVFEGKSAVRVPVVFLRQALESPPFRVSAYHRLQGYEVFGVRAIPVLGVFFLAVAAVFLLRRRGRAAAGVALIAILLYGARFSLDLARYTASHVSAWNGGESYEDAGSAYVIADAIRAEADGGVLVCSEGTSYLPTLLRYLLYPRRVETAVPAGGTLGLAVVAEQIGGKSTPDAVVCQGKTLPASVLRAFPDGSVLYRLRRA